MKRATILIPLLGIMMLFGAVTGGRSGDVFHGAGGVLADQHEEGAVHYFA